jgi:hypothetical protein
VGTPCHTAHVNLIVHFCPDSLQHIPVYGCHSDDDVPRPHIVRLLSLGLCQGRHLRTTPAKWSSRIEIADHRRCGNHKQGHAGKSGQIWTTRLTCAVWHGVPTLSVCKVTYQHFDSFSNYWCISRDCRLTGYFIINMWKCYHLFKLPCSVEVTNDLNFTPIGTPSWNCA